MRIRRPLQPLATYELPQYDRKQFIRLDANENLFGCSPKVVKALSGVTAQELAIYPQYDKFNKILANFLKVKPEQVLPTNGSDEAIALSLEMLCEKGGEILLVSPTFSMFKIYCQRFGLSPNEIPLNEDFSFPLEKFLSSINEKTRIAVIVNPNNPTGTELTKEEVKQILIKAKLFNCFVLVDETYAQAMKWSAKGLLKEFDNLIYLGTFSKSFGLAGLRIGYMAASEELIFDLKKRSSPYNVNSLALLAVEAALQDLQFVDQCCAKIRQNKTILKNYLRSRRVKFYSSSANFVLMEFGSKSERIVRQLRNKGILVRGFSLPRLKSYVRMNIGTAEQIRQAVKELDAVVSPAALIFDMDGVLVDVSNSYRKVIQNTVKFFSGKEVSNSVIQEYKNQGNLNNDWDLTAAILKGFGQNISRQEVIEKFQEFYRGKNFNGFIKNEKWLLDRQKLLQLSQNFKLAVLTGRPRAEAEFALIAAGCNGIFQPVKCLEDLPAEKAKPNPFGLELIMKELGVKTAVYIGDAVDDIQAARAAGIECIAVIPPGCSDPEQQRKIFEQAGASTVLESVNQLQVIL